MSKLEGYEEKTADNDFGVMAKARSCQEELERLNKEFNKVHKALYKRDVIRLKEPSKTKSEISIMQFNILADGLSGIYEPDGTKKVFSNVPKECLKWQYRGARILEEIVKVRPDIITFEEIDQIAYFKNYLAPEYDCHYEVNKKSPCVKVGTLYNHKLLPDGIAIFYRKKKICVFGCPKI